MINHEVDVYQEERLCQQPSLNDEDYGIESEQEQKIEIEDATEGQIDLEMIDVSRSGGDTRLREFNSKLKV